MNNHTHLPWVLKEFKNEFVIRGPDIKWLRSHSTDPLTDAKMKESERGLRELADARLMTASPELFQACINALPWIVDAAATIGHYPAVISQLKEAIAKAKGEL